SDKRRPPVRAWRARAPLQRILGRSEAHYLLDSRATLAALRQRVRRASILRHERAAAEFSPITADAKERIAPFIECDPHHMPCFGAAILLAHITILAKNRKEFSQKLTIPENGAARGL
ncbi:MAG TPA: hypothetical protein VJ747_15365, partial [Stellaceae bacterium]|nr:hypothetical protein [Stellaceae bacterium]